MNSALAEAGTRVEQPASDYSEIYLNQISGDSVPLVMVVPEMFEDVEACSRAEKLIQAAGAAALSNEVIAIPQSPETATGPRYSSLLDALKSAPYEPEARKLAGNCVRTDQVERTMKAGMVIKVDMSVQGEGEDLQILQHGQTTENISINALRYASGTPQILTRTLPEVRNGQRIKILYRQGLLKDHYLVVKSRYADNMSEEEAIEAGFFSDTKSCAIQATTCEGDGLTTEAAFVAGVKSLGGEQHDEQTVVRVGARLGVDLSGKTAAEIIDTPILVHKSLMPNGVIDLVRLYDDEAGGTFFGEDKPRQDYLVFREVCAQREAALAPTTQAIVEQLIAEAGTMQSLSDATKRLAELSQQKMVDYAIKDKTINPRVFGPAASHIEDARFWLEQGNQDRLIESRDMAQKTAKSFSCPTANKRDEKQDGKSSSIDENTSEKKTMSCPYCGAKVWGDPCAKVLTCWDCKAFAKNGRVIYKGDGGHKKRAERKSALDTRLQKTRTQMVAAAASRADRRSEAAKNVEAVFRESSWSF